MFQNRCKELETLNTSLQEKLTTAEETIIVISKTSEVIAQAQQLPYLV